MRIVFCLNNFLPYQVAGTEVYTFQLAKHLQVMGCGVAVVFPNRPKLYEHYTIEGIPVYAYAEPDFNDRALIKGYREPAGLPNFIALIRELQPDLIHFQELEGGTSIGWAHVKAAKHLGYKCIMTFHLSHYSCFTGTMMYTMNTSCDGVIHPSKCTYCSMRSRGVGKLQASFLNGAASLVKTLGIDTRSLNSSIGTGLGMYFMFEQKKRQLIDLSVQMEKLIVLTDWYKQVLLDNGIADSKIIVIKQGLPHPSESRSTPLEKPTLPLKLIFIGRINKFKGLHVLLKAMETIPGEKIHLDIYGQGYDDEYERMCKLQMKSKENIRWMGKLEPGSVMLTLQNYHALCLPSTFSEMSPLVIQEAFGAGIPVIASDVPGNAEQVQHGVNGLLFVFNDAGSLYQQLMSCINDPAFLEHLSTNVSSPRSFEQVATDYYQLYQQLLL